MTSSQLRMLNQDALVTGTRVLARLDPDLNRIFQKLGAPPLWARRPGYATLVHIILEQQVSLQAARTMMGRLRAHCGDVTPSVIHACGVSGLRALGLTRQKARYCHELATRLLDDTLDLSAVARAPDAVGREMLLAVPGLGNWSVDCYYLMALRRPDIWPRGDLALAVALQDVKGLRKIPSAERQELIARRWTPWRSVAARMLWSHYIARRRPA